MKRTSVCPILLAIIAASSACGMAKATRLTYMMQGPDPMVEGLRQVMAEFYKDTGIKVDLIRAAGNELADKAIAMFAAGKGPDLLAGGEPPAQLVANGVFMPIDALLRKDPEAKAIEESLLPGTWAMALRGKNRYILPNSLALQVMYINNDRFASAGMKVPSEDWNWDDFLLAARKMTRNSATSPQFGYAFEPWGLDAVLPWVNQSGGRMFDNWYSPTTPLFSSDKTKEAFKFIHDLRWKHHVVRQPSEGSADVVGEFAKGTNAMFMHWPARIPTLTTSAKFRWSIQLLPGGREKASVGAVDGPMMNKATKYPKEAYKFMKYLCRPKAQRIMGPLGQIPANRDVAYSDVYLGFPKMNINKAALMEQAATTYDRVQDARSFPGETNRIFLEEWNKAWNANSLTVDQALKAIDKRIADMWKVRRK